MRQPPYAKAIKLAAPSTWSRFEGMSPDGHNTTFWVAAGSDAWGWARRQKDRRLVTLLPPDEEPENLDWSLLRGHPPVLVKITGEIDPEVTDRLAAAILRDGGGYVLVLPHDGECVRYTVEEPTA